MNKTENLKLNVWEKTDPILVGDFNEDNRKIDAAVGALTAGAVKIYTGSYTGTGQYGAGNPNSLEFPFTPQIVIIQPDILDSSGCGAIIFQGQKNCVGMVQTHALQLKISWSDEHKKMQWFTNQSTAEYQLNGNGIFYRYIVIG